MGRGLESRGGNAQGGRGNGSHVLTAGEIMPMGDWTIPWNDGELA
jgi:hypothetical protein